MNAGTLKHTQIIYWRYLTALFIRLKQLIIYINLKYHGCLCFNIADSWFQMKTILNHHPFPKALSQLLMYCQSGCSDYLLLVGNYVAFLIICKSGVDKYDNEEQGTSSVARFHPLPLSHTLMQSSSCKSTLSLSHSYILFQGGHGALVSVQRHELCIFPCNSLCFVSAKRRFKS